MKRPRRDPAPLSRHGRHVRQSANSLVPDNCFLFLALVQKLERHLEAVIIDNSGGKRQKVHTHLRQAIVLKLLADSGHELIHIAVNYVFRFFDRLLGKKPADGHAAHMMHVMGHGAKSLWEPLSALDLSVSYSASTYFLLAYPESGRPGGICFESGL